MRSEEFIVSSCTGKQAFETRGRAERVQKRRADQWDREYQRAEVYHCRVCSRFHIGAREGDRGRIDPRVDRKRDRYGKVRLWV